MPQYHPIGIKTQAPAVAHHQVSNMFPKSSSKGQKGEYANLLLRGRGYLERARRYCAVCALTYKSQTNRAARSAFPVVGSAGFAKREIATNPRGSSSESLICLYLYLCLYPYLLALYLYLKAIRTFLGLQAAPEMYALQLSLLQGPSLRGACSQATKSASWPATHGRGCCQRCWFSPPRASQGLGITLTSGHRARLRLLKKVLS